MHPANEFPRHARRPPRASYVQRTADVDPMRGMSLRSAQAHAKPKGPHAKSGSNPDRVKIV